jgi:hypothetical protein
MNLVLIAGNKHLIAPGILSILADVHKKMNAKLGNAQKGNQNSKILI